jgi:hypothetical protein
MEIWQLYKEYTASWVRGLVRTRGVVVEDIDAVIDALEQVREGVELLSTGLTSMGRSGGMAPDGAGPPAARHH